MKQNYRNWLEEHKYDEGTVTAQLYRTQRVEECYGDLVEHYERDRLQDVISDLRYSTDDERQNRPNTSKISFKGDNRNNLSSYKTATKWYRNFLDDSKNDEIGDVVISSHKKSDVTSKKQFLLSHGATCDNWYWSWSYVNHDDKIVIFGSWNTHAKGEMSLILSTEWEISDKGKKQAGYSQSIKHIRLIDEEGYKLQTFPIVFSDDYQDEHGSGPSKIKRFEPVLTDKKLKRVGQGWYASDGEAPIVFPEELSEGRTYVEGLKKTISVNTYERSADARKKCLDHHGYQCSICSFDFEKIFGDIGENYIHVHHIIPIADIKREYDVDPVNDLIPVCPNCHAMIHRIRPALTIEQLKQHIQKVREGWVEDACS